MTQVAAFGVESAEQDLGRMTIERRDLEPFDVDIDILYCGVCHSDLHFVRNDWGMSAYPVVPGHEIVGQVTAVGDKVSRLKVGDKVAVGCIIDSCRTCQSCKDDLEQYCEGGMVSTYGTPDPKHGADKTYGGYSEKIVVDENYVLRVPDNLDLAAAAPLLCAGITTWSPLRHWDIGKGDTVGVIGLGGLGHMAVKLAAALGAKVVMITTSPAKGEDAMRLGASEVLVSTDEEAMQAKMNTFDLLMNTIPVGHDVNPYMPLLKRDGTMVMVGALEPLTAALHSGLLVFGRRGIAGSMIGGIKETQEMLDFCGEHNIVSDVEVIPIQEINHAYQRMLKSDVKYRFVIDMSSLKK